MKRHSLLLTLVVAALAMCGPAMALFPTPDGYQWFQMKQGWYGGYLAWYICTDTNDIPTAQMQNLTLSPLLSSLDIGSGAGPVYVVLNPMRRRSGGCATRRHSHQLRIRSGQLSTSAPRA